VKLDPGSGVIWRVTADAAATNSGPALGLIIDGALLVLLLAAAIGLAWSRGGRIASVPTGALAGVLAGLAMGALMMFVVSPVLQLPWYAGPRVLATMVMGRAAVADILSFDLASFVVGVVVLLLLSALLGVALSLIVRRRDPRTIASGVSFGLAVWGGLQFFLLPVVFPLVSDKGFPPMWYAISFGLFGFVLALILAVIGRWGRSPWGRPNAAPPT
jgi:hypothetical protein